MAYYAYRIVKTRTLGIDDFKSHQQLGRLRPRTLPPADPDPWDGCSVLATLQQAQWFAKRRPRLGGFIAELRIPDEAPITRDAPTSSGHFNLWGDPAIIFSCVTDVTTV